MGSRSARRRRRPRSSPPSSPADPRGADRGRDASRIPRSAAPSRARCPPAPAGPAIRPTRRRRSHSGRKTSEALAVRASLDEVTARSTVCRACPRLVRWREEVAVEKRRAFVSEPYWGQARPGLRRSPSARSSSSGSRRQPTGAIAPDACSPAIGAATGSSAPCTGQGSPLSPARPTRPTGYGSPGRASSRPCAARHRRTGRPRPSATPARHWFDRELELVLPSLAAIVALGSFAWSAALGRPLRAAASPSRDRVRASATAGALSSRPVGTGCSCSGATTRASRTRSPAGSRSRCSTRSSRAR